MTEPKLVDGWSTFWRWYSMWMHAIGTTIGGMLLLVPSMPEEVQALIPVELRATLVALWFAAGIYFRVRSQKDKINAAD